MEVGGLETRDDDVDLLELPSYLSARRLYIRYCAEMGWKVELKNAKGGYEMKRMENFEEDNTYEPCCWKTFMTFWKHHYPKIVICKPREDICNECYCYANSFRFRFFAGNNNQQASGVNNDEAAEKNDFESREKAIQAAALHVRQAAAQRKYFIDKSLTTTTGHPDGVDVLVGDFMQNMGLPYLGQDQPGATYYFFS
jgi:hypothetical protein